MSSDVVSPSALLRAKSRTLPSGTPLLRTTSSDRYFDYCLEPYSPRRPPEGKLRSENLLWHALECAGLREKVEPLLRDLQAQLGLDMVVWGVKFDGDALFFELYIYDPQKEDPAARYVGLQEIFAPHFPLRPEVPSSLDAMMVSVDLDAATVARGEIEEVNLYLTGSTRHEGRSYIARGASRELANLYRFLDPKREIDILLPLLKASAFLDFAPRAALAQVLIPELFACKRVCIGQKRERDGVYFSGIDVDQLLFALRRFAWPSAIVDFVQSNAGELDHLYFDVGVDFVQEGEVITPFKSSFYGTI